ncbi:MAG: hypothetical protein HKP48_10265 [Winogradskyella sp.]|uniref:hypothetical protein n=1 Tax=Winogradskyella sp. TaxID=1883156 RepID=UPI00183C566C|nr:hypothetical protein [Winogradskyella sp.]MBT8245348.1 hypothetical protein [Winogradskyella sp.]NNK23649.1 hypothetical protein [Winogradskyella sp.]
MECYLNNRFKVSALLICLFFVLGCKDNEEQAQVDEKETLVMYQPSEMAKLMNAFYDYNQSLKASIVKGESLKPMPKDFLKIHTAQMTDANGRNATFRGFAPAFLKAQQNVLDSLSQTNLKSRYNNTINLCIACHKTECVGPIPRIKKLLIQ